MGYLDLERQLAEAQANMADQARREIAEIASGHWPNVERPIFDPISVLQAFKGKLWTERDALKATLEQARGALTVAWADCLRGFCVRGEPLPRPGYPSLRETVESTLAALDVRKEARG